MRKRYYIDISVELTHLDMLERLARDVGAPKAIVRPLRPGGGYPSFGATFYEDDPGLRRVRDFAARFARRCSERLEYVYSPTELRAAELLAFDVGRSPMEMCAPEFGTEYDLSTGCPLCGTAARQVGPLNVKRSVLPRSGQIGCTVDGVEIACRSLADALRAAGIGGLELREVVNWKTGEPLGWFQMLASHVLPPLDRRTSGIIRGKRPDEQPCPECRRDGHFGQLSEPMVFVYNRREVDPSMLPDVSVTWEHFGKTGRNEDGTFWKLATPCMLVKPTIYRIFKEQKVRRAIFEPVRFVD